jgi:hypothetical protein
MTPFATTSRRFVTLALGALLASVALLDRPAGALAAVRKKSCTTLERRLDTKLRRGLKGCAAKPGVFGPLRCSGDKRDRHVAMLAAQGCPAPAWAVRVETIRVSEATTAVVWTGRLNWARLLDRIDDPIASTARRPEERFENVLLLDPSSDLVTVVEYVADLEARATDVEGGLPGALTGLPGGRPAFPGVGDRSPDAALDALGELFLACEEGEPGLFESDRDGDGGRKIGGVSGEAVRNAGGDLGADNGGRGLAFARLVVDIIDKLSEPDEPEPDPPSDSEPADTEQCVENADGKCNEGGENPDDEQSQEGSDDPEGTDDTPPAGGGTQPAPGAGQKPASDPGSPDGETCGGIEAFTTVCDSIEWQSPTCRAFVRHMNGCADESLIDPGPDGDTTCSGEGMSAEEVRQLECERRGGIAQPGPDGQLVCRTVDVGQRIDLLDRFDPCNNPEALTTDEMCAQQGGGGIVVDGDAPPTPRPDPRTRAR